MKSTDYNIEMQKMIRENRHAIYAKPKRYFNRDGNLYSAIKFLFLIELIAFLILAFTGGSLQAQQLQNKNLLKTEYSFQSGISNYTAVYNTGKVFLNWSASNEQADCIYIIERSADGQIFESVGVKEGIGASIELFYSWMDASPPIGFSYYRIKKITRDGTQLYSAVSPVINQGASDPNSNYAKSGNTNKTGK